MRHSFYPTDWQTIARAIKEANGWCCAACDKQCRRPGELWLGWEYTLTVAHWDHDYDGAEMFAVACCLPCHLAHDAPYSWVARLRRQRWRQRASGQLELLFR